MVTGWQQLSAVANSLTSPTPPKSIPFPKKSLQNSQLSVCFWPITINSLLCNGCYFPFPPCLPSWEMLYWSLYAPRSCSALDSLLRVNLVVLLWRTICIFFSHYFRKWQRARGRGVRKGVSRTHVHNCVGVFHAGQTLEHHCLPSGTCLAFLMFPSPYWDHIHVGVFPSNSRKNNIRPK